MCGKVSTAMGSPVGSSVLAGQCSAGFQPDPGLLALVRSSQQSADCQAPGFQIASAGGAQDHDPELPLH